MYTSRSAAVKCSVCGRPAIVRIPYARLSLCRDHFLEFVERKVDRSIRRYKLFSPRDLLVVAVSGGKDSTALAYILSKLHPHDRMLLLHINLGIPGYSDEQEETVRKLAQMLGVKLLVFHVEELTGAPSIGGLARKVGRPVCSVCGIVKRYVINAVAVEAGAVAVTGHTLDDAAAYIVKDFITQQLDQLAKWQPRNEPTEGAAAKARPLVEVSEKETLLYSLLARLPVIHRSCPHRPRRPVEDEIKEFLNKLEEQHPGIKISFLRSFVKNSNRYRTLIAEWKPEKCKACGLITSGELCSFCRVTSKYTGKPLGPKVRELVRRKLKELGVI